MSAPGCTTIILLATGNGYVPCHLHDSSLHEFARLWLASTTSPLTGCCCRELPQDPSPGTIATPRMAGATINIFQPTENARSTTTPSIEGRYNCRRPPFPLHLDRHHPSPPSLLTAAHNELAAMENRRPSILDHHSPRGSRSNSRRASIDPTKLMPMDKCVPAPSSRMSLATDIFPPLMHPLLTRRA